MGENARKTEDSSDPLSATGMFLRDFASPGKDPQPKRVPDAVPTQSATTVEEGEFTRLFRPVTRPQTSPPLSQLPSIEPVSPSTIQQGPSPSPAETAGEFTRIFVLQPPSVPEELVSVPQTPIAAGKAKGFSSPGVSDSASAAGSFTQMFHPLPASITQTRASEALARELSAPPPASAPAPPWQPAMAAPEIEPSAGFSDTPASVTELLNIFSGEQRGKPPERREREDWGYRGAPIPQPYREPVQRMLPEDPAPGFAPSAGGVTSLLNRLTDEAPVNSTPSPLAYTSASTEAAAMQSQASAAQAAPVGPIAPAQPGEFTRLIDLVRAPAPGVPTPIQQSASQPPAPAAPTLPLAAMAIPAHSTVPAAPNLTPPKPSATATPLALGMAGKLKEMLPLLLVANAFLMIILIIVVLFALHAR
jgi:hypothetical protein